ncbi:hypothetical protein G3A43_42045, partial [Paraburkholderia aspalathi]|uniref:hypothetical protein n=1 Tax=Paraburkholderia nemoris TaxID=2793076 RepID=UPI00190D5DFB
MRFDLARTAFPGGCQRLELAGHRVQVTISNNGGGGMAMPTMSLRIFGMKLADMGALATRGLTGLAVNGDQVSVMAGNVNTAVGGLLNAVFTGTIYSAVPDFSGTPEVSFVVNATSYPGTQDVASIIGGLAQQAGFAFRNHGVTAKIAGQYLSGTVMDQIERVAAASQTIVLLDQQVMHIWPNGG